MFGRIAAWNILDNTPVFFRPVRKRKQGLDSCNFLIGRHIAILRGHLVFHASDDFTLFSTSVRCHNGLLFDYLQLRGPYGDPFIHIPSHRNYYGKAVFFRLPKSVRYGKITVLTYGGGSMSNVDFLRQYWPTLADMAILAENCLYTASDSHRRPSLCNP